MATNERQAREAAELREQIFRALVEFIEQEGYSPLRGELAERLGISLITVRRHMKSLIESGDVVEGKGPRTLRPLL